MAHAPYLAAIALARCQKDPLVDYARVDGEVFFITKDKPRCFWDFTYLVWGYTGDTTRPDQVWVITQP